MSEPVAWMNKHGACMSPVLKEVDPTGGEYTIPLYTEPPQRTWVGLTPEEVEDAILEGNLLDDYPQEFVAIIEAKLKEKNT